jgi:hypothetical protein
MKLEVGVQKILDGEAILLTGSGFSYGAINQNNEDFALARELKRRMCVELGVDVDGHDLPIVSNSFIRKKGADALISFLKREFTAKNITDGQRKISNLNWSRIYSTNYDNIIELATNKSDTYKVPVTPMDDANLYSSKQNIVVHLNGYIDHMTPDSLKNYTKLTNSSYASDTLRNSKWGNLLSLDLSSAKAVFLVGFSLNYDLDISRMIYANEDFKNKTFFINGREIDELTRENLEEFGTVTNFSVDDFIEVIERVSKSYLPKEKNLNLLLSFDKIENRSNLAQIRDRDIMNLFFKGEITNEKMQDFCDLKFQYSCIRVDRERIIEGVKNEDIDLIVIHSSFGNGKTILLENLKFQLSKLGNNVFVYNGNSRHLPNDIKKINDNLDKDIVLIIDDYYSVKSELKYLFELNKAKTTVIVTGRSAIHFHTKDALHRDAGFQSSKTITVNIDDIFQEEITQIYELIDRNGLWGDRASQSTEKKKSALIRDAKRGFSNIMFEILKSNGMFKKLSVIFDGIKYSRNRRIVIATLITNVIRSNIELRDILIMLDSINLTEAEARDAGILEFIDFGKNKIKMKSSIASREILISDVNSDELLEIMVNLFLRANDLNINNKYDYFCRELVSFSNFKILFSGRDDKIVNNYSLEYYESIKNTSFAKKNHFFWLQFAIQKLEQKDYNAAGVYFKNAYSLASSKPYYDTFQIDTHYARYQLEKSINLVAEITPSEAIENFKLADEKLSKSNDGLDKHYSIRQTIYYKDFYNKYCEILSETERLLILLSCKKMLSTIEEYLILCKENNKKVEPYVFYAKKALREIIQEDRKGATFYSPS